MTRNTKEIALIQHRSGNLAEMPKALHQAEIGLAKDANRLFIGNAINTILANRQEFPYQNLEILTEYSNLNDYFKYSYQNNILKAGEETDRTKLREYLPIVINCDRNFTGISSDGTIELNGVEISFQNGNTLEETINKINAYAEDYEENGETKKGTKTYVTSLQTTTYVCLTFVCLDSALTVRDITGNVTSQFGFPTEITYDISMPERKVTEKLDDNLHITDFSIKGDNTVCGQSIYNALVEIYKNYSDEQFYRNVMFPAGTYLYAPKNLETSTDITIFSPFPLISNLHVHGEGIDRTIIKSSSTCGENNILINSIDNNVNPSTSSAYGTNGYPNNILIEDMTFDSSAATISTLCNIVAGTNITFNRVKFKGSTGTTLVNMFGSDSTNTTNNITFTNCIFEGGLFGIHSTEFVENVTINNCTFKNIGTNAIKIGDDTTPIDNASKAFNINGNIIINTPSVDTSTGSCAIKIGKNTQYLSIHQTQFADNLFQNWKNNTYPIPYVEFTPTLWNDSTDYEKDDYVLVGDITYKCIQAHDASSDITPDNPTVWNEYWVREERTNFIDTLDPTTDEKKVLKFHFTQPRWEYLNYLINKEGNVVVVVDGKDEDITADNGLHIKENDMGIDIRSVKSGDVTLTTDNNADITIGKGLESGKPTGNINIEKTLQLNDNNISNENGTQNTTFKTAPEKVLVVDETGTTPYEQLIMNNPDAIPNVAYVKNISTHSYTKMISFKDLANIDGSGALPLINFIPSTYGNNVHVTRISINVRTPFYKVYEDMDKAPSYVSGLTYYKGDVVKSQGSSGAVYAVILKTHQAPTEIKMVESEYLHIVNKVDNLKSVKYIDIIGVDSNNNNYNFTQTYNEDFEDISANTLDSVNIQKNNLFGFTSAEPFTPQRFGGEDVEAKIVSYLNRNYVLLPQDEEMDYTVESLHNTELSTRKYDEGYNYIFECDRNYNSGNPLEENPYTVNLANGRMKMVFYNTDKEQISSFTADKGQLNAAGEILLKIEFIRNEF